MLIFSLIAIKISFYIPSHCWHNCIRLCILVASHLLWQLGQLFMWHNFVFVFVGMKIIVYFFYRNSQQPLQTLVGGYKVCRARQKESTKKEGQRESFPLNCCRICFVFKEQKVCTALLWNLFYSFLCLALQTGREFFQSKVPNLIQFIHIQQQTNQNRNFYG